MAFPTKKQKAARAASFLRVEPNEVRTKGSFWGAGFEHKIREEEEALKAQGYRVEVTDAWGEFGARGYSVVWYTKAQPKPREGQNG